LQSFRTTSFFWNYVVLHSFYMAKPSYIIISYVTIFLTFLLLTPVTMRTLSSGMRYDMKRSQYSVFI
jgi:hypothetical protein